MFSIVCVEMFYLTVKHLEIMARQKHTAIEEEAFGIFIQ